MFGLFGSNRFSSV